jgi:UDP-2,3-diacylglucosamine pyrophosphatase LpxH
VICGHIHHAADRHFHSVHYVNCGDWVESCTAVIETLDGTLRVVRWEELTRAAAFNGSPIAEAAE